MRNPMIGHEAEYTLDPAEHTKKVWVIGGGVAGMEAAQILHERGHQVTYLKQQIHWAENFSLQEKPREKVR